MDIDDVTISCLSTFLLAMCVDDFFHLLYVCLSVELFHFVIFMFLVFDFSFLPREVPLIFLAKLISWC